MSNKLLVKFPDQSQSFTYGVEFGRLLEKIEREEEVVKNNGFPVRIENKELLRETCKKMNYIPVFGNEDFGWVDFMGIKNTNHAN